MLARPDSLANGKVHVTLDNKRKEEQAVVLAISEGYDDAGMN